MTETRKLAAILVADVVGYSRLAGADEDRTLSRLRGLRSDLIDPAIAAHHGRTVKRTGDGSITEFRSVVDAVRCAIEVQTGLVERNAGLPPEKRIEFRLGVHVGDVVEEADGDLMGDGVNIAARLEGICVPGAICLSEDAYRQVKGRLDLAVRTRCPRCRMPGRRPLTWPRLRALRNPCYWLVRWWWRDGHRPIAAAAWTSLWVSTPMMTSMDMVLVTANISRPVART
jgi:class 3 adenylate cyclase